MKIIYVSYYPFYMFGDLHFMYFQKSAQRRPIIVNYFTTFSEKSKIQDGGSKTADFMTLYIVISDHYN